MNEWITYDKEYKNEINVLFHFGNIPQFIFEVWYQYMSFDPRWSTEEWSLSENKFFQWPLQWRISISMLLLLAISIYKLQFNESLFNFKQKIDPQALSYKAKEEIKGKRSFFSRTITVSITKEKVAS